MAPKIAILSATLLLCFSSLLCVACGSDQDDDIYVEGKVYCDTCRVMEETKLSKPLPERKTWKETLSIMAVAEKDARYKIPVIGNHEDEDCAVIPVMSGDMQCSKDSRRRAGVQLTKDYSVIEAAPLSFMVEKPLPECANMDYTPII